MFPLLDNRPGVSVLFHTVLRYVSLACIVVLLLFRVHLPGSNLRSYLLERRVGQC